jgi:hypothetical protein
VEKMLRILSYFMYDIMYSTTGSIMRGGIIDSAKGDTIYDTTYSIIYVEGTITQSPIHHATHCPTHNITHDPHIKPTNC